MNATVDMDDLLEMSLDDLADLPEFKPFPAGSHRCTFNSEVKVVNGERSLEIKLKAIETEELADPTADVPLEPGAETSVLYQLNNEFAQGKLKPIVNTLAEYHNTRKVFEALEATNGMEVVVVTKIRQNKEKTKDFTDLVSIII